MIAVMDSSAIVEIMRGTETGRKALDIIKAADIVIVPSIVLAELTSYAIRNGISTKYIELIEEQSFVTGIDGKVAKQGGKMHAKLKKKERNISLADCIIMAVADEYRGVIVTTDHHFTLYHGKKIVLEH